MTASLATSLDEIRCSIVESRAGSPLAAGQVTLVGASKTQPVEILEKAIRLGMTDFGENKVQEAQAKWPGLKAKHPQVKLHLIGPLQSNKAADAVALFDVIETIDREKIAAAVGEEIRRQNRNVTCYIQVNTGEEPQKGGVKPTELPALLAYGAQIGLSITGLMCIPPADANPAPHFALLRQLAQRHGLTQLSMGMSSDYADAIRLGATAVRIGTRLFGERLPSA